MLFAGVEHNAIDVDFRSLKRESALIVHGTVYEEPTSFVENTYRQANHGGAIRESALAGHRTVAVVEAVANRRMSNRSDARHKRGAKGKKCLSNSTHTPNISE